MKQAIQVVRSATRIGCIGLSLWGVTMTSACGSPPEGYGNTLGFSAEAVTGDPETVTGDVAMESLVLQKEGLHVDYASLSLREQRAVAQVALLLPAIQAATEDLSCGVDGNGVSCASDLGVCWVEWDPPDAGCERF